MEFRDNKSVDICRIALKMSISSREEEKRLIKEYAEKKIKVAAVDVGGAIPSARFKFIESTLLAAKRNGIIQDINGLSVGGKIGIARNGEHLGVAIFLSVGILQFNEVICAVAHRSVAILPNEQEGGI